MVVYMIVKNVHFDQIPFKEQIRAGIWIMEKVGRPPPPLPHGRRQDPVWRALSTCSRGPSPDGGSAHCAGGRQIIEDPSVQVNGIVMVEDMAGMSFALMGEMRSQDPDQIGLKWMQVGLGAGMSAGLLARRPMRPADPAAWPTLREDADTQDCFPVRFKGIHVVNQPWYLSVLMAIIRPFLSQKLADRVRGRSRADGEGGAAVR